AAGVPILKTFVFEKAQDGRLLIVFRRANRPKQQYGVATHPAAALAPAVLLLVDEVVEFTSSPHSRPWFGHCVNILGPEVARFCFAQLKEACSIHKVEQRGALLTKIFQDVARQQRRSLR